MKHKLEGLNPDIEQAIDLCVNSQRDREIMKRRYIDGIRFERLAEEYDLSVVQTKRIVYKWTNVIHKVMGRS